MEMKNRLDYIGEKIILGVRDETMLSFERILDGDMKSTTALQIREKINDFTNEQLGVLKWLMLKVIDMELHNFLTLIEENEDIKLIVVDNKNKIFDVKENSDGLAGELYTSDGWINKYSNIKTT